MENPSREKARKRIKDNITANLRLSISDFAIERALMETKWFGYRFMSPLAATHLFAKEYSRACQKAVYRNRDRHRVVNGVDWRKFGSRSTEFTQMWRARQIADRFCLPYESYLEYCFDFASRIQRKYEPRPNQLHGTGNKEARWLSELGEFMKDREWHHLVSWEADQYHTSNFLDLHSQQQYRAYVPFVAGRATKPWKRVIETFCYLRNEVPTEGFEGIVDADQFNEWLADLDTEVTSGRLSPRPGPELSTPDFWPSCIGLPGASDSNADLCRTCRYAAECLKIATAVTTAVEKQTGHENPVDRAAKDKQNIRQARSRARRREAKKHSTPATPSIVPGMV